MADRLTEFEDRLTSMERSHGLLADAFSDFKVAVGKKHDEMTAAIGTLETTIGEKLDTIETFVGGYNTIAGLAKKHWKTAIVFGAGVMTSLGVGNPKLLTFITTFFGG